MHLALWSILALMTVVALAVIVLPLWRGVRARELSRKQLNIDIYRERLTELEAERAAGRIDADLLQSQTDELGRRLLIEAQDEHHAAIADGARGRPVRVTILLAVVLPAMAFALYWSAGTWRTPTDLPELPYLVQRLEDRVDHYPDDAQAWELLGRARRALGEPEAAAQAFHHANAVTEPPQVALLLQEAAALTVAAHGDLTGQPQQLFLQALTQDPENFEALWLAGLAARQSGQWTHARDYWQRLLKLDLPPEFAATVRAQLDKLPEQQSLRHNRKEPSVLVSPHKSG